MGCISKKYGENVKPNHEKDEKQIAISANENRTCPPFKILHRMRLQEHRVLKMFYMFAHDVP